ncbi:hypothetical protein HNY73_007328 [Argiope bruennichi]|uniref:DDE-1 domain-containing protein n=1 Tax=Argiope bruennichi TaxID=94029 RepID=A0A8T0FGN2_ARGBR|nr:hypothetical protein HNY73_007328 [Argiope bruennichi]
MPRTYVSIRESYSDASLQLAVLAVEKGKSIYAAAKDFEIPYQTLRRWVINKQKHKGGPPGALYACTESGWMQDSVFESWMDPFIKYTENLQKPVLLIYDGHESHMTYGTVKKATDNNIIILCLPPHTSHALQPLDIRVFSPLKSLESNFEEMNAIKGFLGSGIYPKSRKAHCSNRNIKSDTLIRSTNKDSEPSTSTCNRRIYRM